VGPRADMEDVEKRKILPLPGLELQPVVSRYTDWSPSASQSHIATDGQSVYVYSCLKVTVLSMYGALSDETSGLSFVSHSQYY
jgi:hypothetical protein